MSAIPNESRNLERIEQETTAGEAQMTAQEAGLGYQVQRNVGLAHDAAAQAASSAKMHGSKLTGEPPTATEQFHNELTAKTNAAVTEGQEDVEAAKAAGTGYVEQAKAMAGSALATAQSYLPSSLGGAAQASDNNTSSITESASATAANLVSSVQAGATNAVEATKDFLVSAHNSGAEAAQPHVNQARELAGRVVEGAGQREGTYPPASSTGIPATSAPLESGPHTVGSPYASTTTKAGSGIRVGDNELKRD